MLHAKRNLLKTRVKTIIILDTAVIYNITMNLQLCIILFLDVVIFLSFVTGTDRKVEPDSNADEMEMEIPIIIRIHVQCS